MPMRILTVTGIRPALSHGGAHDRLEQPPLVRQRRAAAAPGDLGNGAAEVQVHVIGEVPLGDDPDGGADRRGIHPVDLHGPRLLVRIHRDHAEGQRVVLHEPARGDHLADVEARALLTTQAPEARVRDAGHRRQHHGGVGRVRADAQRLRARGGDSGGTHAVPLSSPSELHGDAGGAVTQDRPNRAESGGSSVDDRRPRPPIGGNLPGRSRTARTARAGQNGTCGAHGTRMALDVR